MCSDLIESSKDELLLASLDSSGLLLIRNIADSSTVETIIQKIELDLKVPQNSMDDEHILHHKFQFVSMHQANPYKIIWTRDKVENGPKLILVDTETNRLQGFYEEE